MSSNDGIYILATIKNTKRIGFTTLQCQPYKVYRFAYATAIDNFDWYKENEPHNLGAYILEMWGGTVSYTNLDDAKKDAAILASKFDNLEYGIVVIDTDLKIYKDN